jgi:AraC family transcriptional regulator
MIRHALTALSIGMLIFFLYLAQYTGAFKSVTVGLEDRGPYTLVFKNHSGPYHQIIESLQNVEAWAKLNSVDCQLTFGEFFDDPGLVEEGRLRSRTGCLIDSKNTTAMLKLKSVVLPNDIKIDEFKKVKSVVALFSGSPGIGPYKVYPKAQDFIKINNLKHIGSTLEIYEVLGPKAMNTTYIWPVEEIQNK